MYSKQQDLLIKLGELERTYAGLYPTQNRKFTVKWCKNTLTEAGSIGRPYLYTWVNWAEGETEKYSVEAGKTITRTNYHSLKETQQNVYICPVTDNETAIEEMYFKGADERVLNKIQDLREALEKQISLIGKHSVNIRRELKLDYKELTEEEKKKIEEETLKLLTKRYSGIFSKNEENLLEIVELIKKKEKEKKLVLLFKENKIKEKEEKRIKKEKEKQERERKKRESKKGV